MSTYVCCVIAKCYRDKDSRIGDGKLWGRNVLLQIVWSGMASWRWRDVGGETRRKGGQVMWLFGTRAFLEEESECKVSETGACLGHLGESTEGIVAGAEYSCHQPSLPRLEPSSGFSLSRGYPVCLPARSHPSLLSSPT